MAYFRYFCYVNLGNLKFSMGGGGILDPRTFLIHDYNLTVYKNYLLKSLFYIFSLFVVYVHATELYSIFFFQ